MKGLSQENVAELLGISLNSFSKIERGETDVSFSRLEQVADVLQIRVNDIVGLNENGFYYMNGSHNGLFINNSSKENLEIVIEVERLRAENQGMKNEVENLKEIISLLKAKV
jgi:transcriptional regulator with XRE-family HTH domain